MNLIMAAFLGLVQGVSEFLPISSSGHLNLIQALFGVQIEHQLFFNIMLHMGTLVAVGIVFWKDWLHMICHPIKDKTLLLLFIASMPALIAKIIFDKPLHYAETHNSLLGICFLITGLLLIYIDFASKKNKKNNKVFDEHVTMKHALSMGTMQAFGMLPGISRSGSTIFGGVASNLNRETAAKFSFMMSAPAIVAGSVSEGISVFKEGAIVMGELPAIFVGMVIAAVSGYITIRFFLKLISNTSLKWFAFYMILIGIVTIVLQITGVIPNEVGVDAATLSTVIN